MEIGKKALIYEKAKIFPLMVVEGPKPRCGVIDFVSGIMVGSS